MKLFYSDHAPVPINSEELAHLYVHRRTSKLTADDILETIMLLEKDNEE